MKKFLERRVHKSHEAWRQAAEQWRTAVNMNNPHEEDYQAILVRKSYALDFWEFIYGVFYR